MQYRFVSLFLNENIMSNCLCVFFKVLSNHRDIKNVSNISDLPLI